MCCVSLLSCVCIHVHAVFSVPAKVSFSFLVREPAHGYMYNFSFLKIFDICFHLYFTLSLLKFMFSLSSWNECLVCCNCFWLHDKSFKGIRFLLSSSSDYIPLILKSSVVAILAFFPSIICKCNFYFFVDLGFVSFFKNSSYHFFQMLCFSLFGLFFYCQFLDLLYCILRKWLE